MEEIWKDIPGYEGLYQVSNLGRVYSLPKKWNAGNNGSTREHNGLMLTQILSNGDRYYSVKLTNGKKYKVHILVAMAFLNYLSYKDKFVVDHINNIQTDNKLENLQLITQRENLSKDKIGGTSKYTGVYFNKKNKTFISVISIEKKRISLGSYKCEFTAGKIYKTALKLIDKFDGDKKKFRELVLNYPLQLDETK